MTLGRVSFGTKACPPPQQMPRRQAPCLTRQQTTQANKRLHLGSRSMLCDSIFFRKPSAPRKEAEGLLTPSASWASKGAFSQKGHRLALGDQIDVLR